MFRISIPICHKIAMARSCHLPHKLQCQEDGAGVLHLSHFSFLKGLRAPQAILSHSQRGIITLVYLGVYTGSPFSD